jgi:hypothetical protein
MDACLCSCHKGGLPCGICCAEVAKKFLEPVSREDKSKDILDKYLKGKK